ncbi:hypothetical protein [Tritonibacter mobilis]|uniref:hypothetical protein n=1 Tax=Tritonibacter mobilis TaxID=379347 RepID=UPI0039A6C1B8
MPYVEVWVDDEPCDGKCESADEAKRLQAIIDEAEMHLRNGDAAAALAALSEDAVAMKTPGEIAARYKDWQAGKLPGFANYIKSN